MLNLDGMTASFLPRRRSGAGKSVRRAVSGLPKRLLRELAVSRMARARPTVEGGLPARARMRAIFIYVCGFFEKKWRRAWLCPFRAVPLYRNSNVAATTDSSEGASGPAGLSPEKSGNSAPKKRIACRVRA